MAVVAPVVVVTTFLMSLDLTVPDSRAFRWLITILVVVPITVMAFIWKQYGLYLLLGTIAFFKVLMNQGVVSNSILFLLIFVIGLAFSLRPTKVNNIPGRNAYFLLVIAFLLQSVRALDFVEAINSILGMLSVAIMFYVVAPRLRQREARYAVLAYLIGAFLFGVMALSGYDWSIMGRLGEGIELNPNNIALYMSTMLIISVYLIVTERRISMLLLLSVVVATFVLVLTGSRTFLVASTIGLLFFLRSKYALVAAALVLGVLLVTIVASAWAEWPLITHISKGLFSDNLVTLEGISTKRWELLMVGLRIFYDHPIVGIGLGNFAEAAHVYHGEKTLIAHDLYLSIAAELGVFALLILVCWNLSLLLRSFRGNNNLAFSLTIMYCIVGMLSGNYLDPEYAVIWAIAFALVRESRQRGLTGC